MFDPLVKKNGDDAELVDKEFPNSLKIRLFHINKGNNKYLEHLDEIKAELNQKFDTQIPFRNFLLESYRYIPKAEIDPPLGEHLLIRYRLADLFIDLINNRGLFISGDYRYPYFLLIRLRYKLMRRIFQKFNKFQKEERFVEYFGDSSKLISAMREALDAWLDICIDREGKKDKDDFFEDTGIWSELLTNESYRIDREEEVFDIFYKEGNPHPQVDDFFSNQESKTILNHKLRYWFFSRYDLKNANEVLEKLEWLSKEEKSCKKKGNEEKKANKLHKRLAKVNFLFLTGQMTDQQYQNVSARPYHKNQMQGQEESDDITGIHLPRLKRESINYIHKQFSRQYSLKSILMILILLAASLWQKELFSWKLGFLDLIGNKFDISFFSAPNITKYLMIMLYVVGACFILYKICCTHSKKYQFYLPRLIAGIIVGYILLMTDEAWRWADFKLSAQLLLGLSKLLIPLGASFIYLYIQVNNTTKEPKRVRQRVFSIFGQGLFYALIIGLIMSDLFGQSLIRQPLNIVFYSGLFGRIYPQSVLFLSPVALFIGLFTQILWQDTPLTVPI